LVENNSDVSVLLNPTVDDQLLQEGFTRHFKSGVQKVRKNTGIHLEDFIEVFIDFDSQDKFLTEAFKTNWDSIVKTLKSPLGNLKDKPAHLLVLNEETFA